MQIVLVFPTHKKRIRPSLGKLVQEKVRVGNHQVRLQRQTRYLAKRLDDRRPNRNVRYEVSIHDIHVDAIRPGLLRLAHLLAQMGKVSREDGRGKFSYTLVHILKSVLVIIIGRLTWSRALIQFPDHGLFRCWMPRRCSEWSCSAWR